MEIGFKVYKTYLEERTKCYPFMKGMIDFYNRLIEIWDEALPDDLSPLFSVERLSRGLCMLDGERIGDVDFTNSIDTARKIFKLTGEGKIEYAVGLSDPPAQEIVDFIRDSLSREERFSNVILKWILKLSFNYTIGRFVQGEIGGIWRRCPLCSSPPGMAIVYTTEQRLLSCCFCGFRWPFDPVVCPACDNDRPERTGFFLGESGCDEGTRAVSCEECKSYIKTVFVKHRSDSRGPGDLDIDIEDVATIPLDMIANQRGYRAICQEKQSPCK